MKLAESLLSFVVRDPDHREPILGDLLARCVLAAAVDGVSAPLRSLHAAFGSVPHAEESLDVHLTSGGGIV